MCARALSDPSTEDVSCTYFDHISRSSHTVTKCLIQMGTGKAQRIMGEAHPTVLVPKQRENVFIELSYEEFGEHDYTKQWCEFGRTGEAFLKGVFAEMLPPDDIIETVS